MVNIHATLIDIGTDAFFRWVLAFLPASVSAHLWRTLRYIIIEGDDGLEVVFFANSNLIFLFFKIFF